MAASLRDYWARRAPAQTFLYAVGALLVLWGIAHLGVFFVDGGPWDGPVSWRKPVTFGVSFGVTALAVAFVATFLSLGRRSSWLLLGSFGVASALEVLWVSVQRWRGVPSHFAKEGLDAALFFSAGLTIGVIGLVLVVVNVLAMRRLDAPPSMALAIRAGLVLLLVGQVLGGAIIANGNAIDRLPTEAELAVFGAAGAMKVPHAVALHAIEVLPALAWVLGFASPGEGRRRFLVAVGAAGYAALVPASAAQTFAGLAPLDLAWPGAVLALVGLAGLAGAWAAALAQLCHGGVVEPALSG
ncbi:MAG TPA: hypothetical protein VK975_03820 [Acidimicrobiales bacterium]|nr:hypothetical protein [Acidimicrobiales bacterium]